MSRPARVLWLAKGLGRGGAEKLLVTGAAHLDPQRFDVEVAYLLPHKDALVPELLARGLRVHCLGQRSELDLRWLVRLKRLMDQQFAIVHTHMPIPAVAARLLTAGGGPAIVHTEHNVWDRYRRPTYWANALTYGRNDAVIAVSQAVADSVPGRHRPRPPATMQVLLHGVEQSTVAGGPAARAAARRSLGLPADAFVIGTVGNFTPKKDQRGLIAAFAAVRSRRLDARLVLVGTGPLEAALREQVASAGLSADVLFAGSREDVTELLPAFDVFALSSLHEGLSIALVEAMAAGVPAVCTHVGGVPEAMRDDVEGRLVPPQDPAALAETLGRLADDRALLARYAGAALERGKLFDIATALRRIEEVYDSVLKRRAAC